MRVQLTDTAIRAAVKRAAETGARQELADTFTIGLRLRVTPNGVKTWVLGCRDKDGRARRFTLGKHDAMGITEARKAAGDLRQAVQVGGADPVAADRKRRAEVRDAAQNIGTLSALLDLYGGPKPDRSAPAAKPGRTGPGGKLKSWPEGRRRIESVFADHLDKPLSALKAEALQLAADKHPSEISAAAAVRCLRPVLKWAAKRRYLARDAADLQAAATVARRDRVLDREELGRLLPVLAASANPYARAHRFLLWTLARREEVGGARWRDVSLDAATWSISETKNGQPHIVPLPRQAVAFLASIRPPGAAPGDLIFANANGGRLMNWDRFAKSVMAESKTAGWTRHDLRRTGATMLGNMGETPDVIEAALNHTAIRSALAATYNRSRYRPQVAAALQKLADALEGIAAGGAEIVPLRSGRKKG